MNKGEYLPYMRRAVAALNAAGHFANGLEFRPSQKEAYRNIEVFLNDPTIPDEEKTTFFIDMATGLGKTNLFLGLADKMMELAHADGKRFEIVINVPTIPIFQNTYGSMKEVAPTLYNNMSLYGDGHNDLSGAVKVMTNPAFVSCYEQAWITPETVDMVVNDEGHLHLSEMKQDVMDAFEGHCIKMAVTATSEYDENKSLYKTHRRCVYKKTVVEGIKSGELAASAHVQIYKIRVDPTDEATLQHVFNREALDEEGYEEFSRRYKEEKEMRAWAKQVVRVWRNGYNQHTDEPLTDNFSAFFAKNTRGADILFEELSADPELQKIAATRGLELATVVHTRGISPAEQQKRLDAYMGRDQNGTPVPRTYLGIAADEKIRLGWDDPPTKNLFKWHDQSRLKAAQTLGRPLRQWWNPAKRRYEGATIIDTFTYTCAKEDDEKVWQELITKAYGVIDILNAPEVLGPDASPPAANPRRSLSTEFNPKKAAKKSRPAPIRFGDAEVTSYIERDDVFTIMGEMKETREKIIDRSSYILITKEDRKKLEDEATRTGLKGEAIFSRISNVPYNMTLNHADRIVRGQQRSAPKIWTETLIETYAAQPDNKNLLISQEIFQKIKSESLRTSITGHELFSKLQAPPKGLKAHHIERIIKGTQKKAPQTWITAILETYSKQKSQTLVVLSSQTVKKLQEEAKRTGLGGVSIFNCISSPPKGLTRKLSDKILQGKRKKLPFGWAELILKEYSSKPSVLKIPTHQLEKLQRESERTQLGGKAIFSRMEKPSGMESEDVLRIISGQKKQAPIEWISALLEAYKQQPNCNSGKIPASMTSKLQLEFKRTGLSGRKIFNLMSQPPPNMQLYHAERIVAGTITNAPKEWTKLILDMYSVQPNNDKVLLTKEIIKKFQEEKKRTGLSGYRIFAKIETPPKDMNEFHANNIIEGKIKKVALSWINKIFEAYAQQNNMEISLSLSPNGLD